MVRFVQFKICLVFALFTVVMAEQEVIVVGGGLAGISASIEATIAGARVTLVEKEKSIGGNSAKATSGINGAETIFQNHLDIHDNYSIFEKDTLGSGDGLSDHSLVGTLTSSSKSAIEFLHSFDLALDDVIKLGGHSVARTHRFSPTKEGRPVPVGFTLVSKLKKHLETNSSDKITVLTQSRFTGLLHQGGNVIGIKYLDSEGSEKELYGNVILTAGGYGHDRSSDSLLMKHVPHLYNLPTTNGPWSTGDIIKATIKDNLALTHMDKVQVHPTSFFDPKNPKSTTNFLAPESLRGCGGILLNGKGKRFVNELGRRDHVTNAIFEKCDNFENDPSNPKVCVMLLNERAVKRFGEGTFNFYKSRGFVRDAGSLGGAAEILKVDPSSLKETLLEYKSASAVGRDEFDKTTFPVLFEPNDNFFVAYITPAIHYCMGGLKINDKGQVLSGENDLPIRGLYAAGEVTGGLHGQNRLAGNSLLECVVFGRIVGREASAPASVKREEM